MKEDKGNTVLLVLTRGVAELSCFGLIPLKVKKRKTKGNNSLQCNYPFPAHKDGEICQQTFSLTQRHRSVLLYF